MAEKSNGWLARLVNRLKSEPPESAWSAAEKAGRAPARRSPAGETVAGDRGRAPLAGDVAEVFSPGPADWSAGQELLDDFVVDRVLGEGGMGKVYLVRSKSTGSLFAVKRAKGLREVDRRSFLAELQHWIDLPDHPNLVACRFFRTVGDEILIFADYVEGGSLQEWIQERRLYEGGPAQALERILDVSIQFAWALHGLHARGLVHQDVKPGNVLMRMGEQASLQGVRPQVTDYGLARARGAAGEQAPVEAGRSLLLSSHGGTRAYWPPEQAMGRPVTARADTWAWGVSVMEMFVGEVSWPSGTVAPHFMKDWLVSRRSPRRNIPAMPAGVADVLRRCFQEDPAERPASLAEVVESLKGSYRAAVRRDYGGALPALETPASRGAGVGERRDQHGTGWDDPKTWLETALKEAGRDPTEAASLSSRRGATRRGDLVSEMAAYDEAKRLYEQLVCGGRKELETDLANLCMNKALVHETAADVPGALHEYDRVIEIQERLVNQEGRRELANDLANGYMNKAVAVMGLGDNKGAIALYDRCIEIQERLVNQEGRRELANDLANGYMNKAVAVMGLGDNKGAIALYDRCIEIQERLVNQEGRRELANDLATAYMNKAIAVRGLGDNKGAIALYDRVIEIRERLVNQEGRRELANDLANGYMNKAVAVMGLGDNKGAIALYDRVIEIQERLVNQEGRRELANDLANGYMNKAVAVMGLGDNKAAIALYDKAIEIWERLVNQEGRRELANDLAMGYMNKATAVMGLGDNKAAIALYDRVIEIRERLVNQEGRRELANDLAKAYMNKAVAVRGLGDNKAAIALYDRCIEIREGLVNQEGRRELANDLANGYMNKAIAVMGLGDNKGAIALYDRVIEIQERLVNQEGRRELAGGLAQVRSYRGKALMAVGQTEEGLREMRAAQTVLQTEIARTGRADLKQVLAWLDRELEKYSD